MVSLAASIVFGVSLIERLSEEQDLVVYYSSASFQAVIDVQINPFNTLKSPCCLYLNILNVEFHLVVRRWTPCTEGDRDELQSRRVHGAMGKSF